MPVSEKPSAQPPLYQRAQYARGGLGRWYWDYRDSVALSLVDDAGGRILDLGCGEGITLEKAVRVFPRSHVSGLDALQENVDICRAHGLSADLGDACALPLPSGSLDAVFLMEVIEHLARPEDALRETLRTLKPAGTLVMVFPNDSTFKLARLLTLKFREASYDPGHLRQWTPASAMDALKHLGFEVLFLKSIPFLLWRLSLHCVVCAAKPAGAAR